MKKSLNKFFTKIQIFFKNIFFEYIACELENIKIIRKLILNNKKKDSRKIFEVSAIHSINNNTVIKNYFFDQIYTINLFKNIIKQISLQEFDSKDIKQIIKTHIKIIRNLQTKIINKSKISYLGET